MKAELRVGDRASAQRVFTSEDVRAYHALVGDTGALDQVPDPLIGGMFSDLLGMSLPGRGTNWMKQQLRFRHPATVGELVTASVEVVRLRPEKDLVNLRTVCQNESGAIICEGEALVMAREMP